ncbi:hypothetical protein LOD99_355 [Oopsacas minuta]|uniref:Uncharacterized protein n=1 Tax=Oopsacas minuta TaxID=111878 RepID=A0AAV7K951_9METZ|nr:hypothetical protein LOD99_355 [Oopsacas minuta]
MASYENFTNEIGKGAIISAYTNVLIDIYYCIQLFNDLEIERTLTEKLFDYFAGERNLIEMENLPRNLEILKKEVETGLQLYMRLSCKMNILNGNPNFQRFKQLSIRNSDKTTPRWGIQQELGSHFDELLAIVADIKVLEKIQDKDGSIIKSYHDRKMLFNTARILYQTLNQELILTVLKKNHALISELILRVEDGIHSANNPQDYNPPELFSDYVYSQRENSPENTERIYSIYNTDPHLHTDDNNSPNMTEEKMEQLGEIKQTDCSHNSNNGVIGDNFDDVTTFYEKLLTKVEINLVELNENKNSERGWWSTWTEESVNYDRIKYSFNKLKGEIQSGIKLYEKISAVTKDISSKQGDFDKKLKNKESQEYHTSRVNFYLENFISFFDSDQEKLTKTFSELKFKVEQENQPTSEVAKCDESKLNYFLSLVSFVPGWYCNESYPLPDSKEKPKLQEKTFSYELLKNKVLDKLQSHHWTISQIFENMKIHQQDLDIFLQKHQTTQVVGPNFDPGVLEEAAGIKD